VSDTITLRPICVIHSVIDILLLVAMCDCEDCLGRTPYASLIATTVMCIGVGLFCGTGFRALDITLNGIFDGLFKFHVSWYVALFCYSFAVTILCINCVLITELAVDM